MRHPFFACALVALALAAASPPAHALDRHDSNAIVSAFETAPPFDAAIAASAILPAVAHLCVAPTADAILDLPFVASPEVPTCVCRSNRAVLDAPREHFLMYAGSIGYRLRPGVRNLEYLPRG